MMWDVNEYYTTLFIVDIVDGCWWGFCRHGDGERSNSAKLPDLPGYCPPFHTLVHRFQGDRIAGTDKSRVALFCDSRPQSEVF